MDTILTLWDENWKWLLMFVCLCYEANRQRKLGYAEGKDDGWHDGYHEGFYCALKEMKGDNHA